MSSKPGRRRENADRATALEEARLEIRALRGGFDTHVHIGPDVVERRVEDLDLARRFLALGLAGFVMKSHYTSTAERASVVRAAVPGIEALGSISLNRAVGGINPLAVEIAAREGARAVWLPTVDAVNESHEREAPPGARLPVWVRLQLDLRERGIEIEPVPVLDEDGTVLPDLRDVMSIVAERRMALATGHLDRDEIFAVVQAASEEGVETIVVTHPEFPTQDLGLEDQLELAGRGALLERCFTTPHTGKVSWERRNLDAVTEVVAPGIVTHNPIILDAPAGADSLRGGIEMIHQAFSDVRVEIRDMVAEGDRVATFVQMSGTNVGEYRRGAATGRSASFRAFFIWRIADGRIVESWGVADRFDALQQLGIIPSDDELGAERPVESRDPK